MTQTSHVGVSHLFLLVLLLGMAGGIVLFIKLSWRGRLGMVLGALVLLFLGVMALRFSASVSPRSVAQLESFSRDGTTILHQEFDPRGTQPIVFDDQGSSRSSVDAREVIELEETPEVPWKSAADLGFEADVHPSQAAAAEALAVLLCKRKDAIVPGLPLKRIQVLNGAELGNRTVNVSSSMQGVSRLDPDAINAVVACLQRIDPTYQVTTADAELSEPVEDQDAQAATIRVQMTARQPRVGPRWDSEQGTIRMRMRFKSGNIEASTKYVAKPWVDNASQFASANPGVQYVVGRSASTAATTSEARRQAYRSAAVQLLPNVRAAVQQMPNQFSMDDRWLKTRIEEKLWAGAWLRDRFVQTLICPSGGQVTREAVLLEAPSISRATAMDVLNYSTQRHETQRSALASALGLVVLVTVLGVAVNAVTKGYYRGRVVAASGALIVLAVVFTAVLVMA